MQLARTGRRRHKDPRADVSVSEPARTGTSTPYILVRDGVPQMLFALSRLDPPVAPPKTGKAERKVSTNSAWKLSQSARGRVVAVCD